MGVKCSSVIGYQHRKYAAWANRANKVLFYFQWAAVKLPLNEIWCSDAPFHSSNNTKHGLWSTVRLLASKRRLSDMEVHKVHENQPHVQPCRLLWGRHTSPHHIPTVSRISNYEWIHYSFPTCAACRPVNRNGLYRVNFLSVCDSSGCKLHREVTAPQEPTCSRSIAAEVSATLLPRIKQTGVLL